jgi:hypothetical protein
MLSRLRAKLKAIFGLSEAPFEPYRSDRGWKARFRVGGDVDAR